MEEFPDGVWEHVPTLADDVILTHRVTESELEIGVLDGEGDLDLWARLADDGIPFASGGELRARYSMQNGPPPPRHQHRHLRSRGGVGAGVVHQLHGLVECGVGESAGASDGEDLPVRVGDEPGRHGLAGQPLCGGERDAAELL